MTKTIKTPKSSKPSKINWQKVVTREYPFLWADYTNDAYKKMESVVGTTLHYNLFFGEQDTLNIYRDPKDVERSYKLIDKVAKKISTLETMMDTYDKLVAKNYQLFKEIPNLKNKLEIKQKLIELDKNFLQTVMYFLFFVFLGYGADKPNIKKFLKKHGQRFDKLRMRTIDMDMKREFPKCFSKYDKALLGLTAYMKRQELLAFLKTGKIDKAKLKQRTKNYLLITKDLKSKEYKLADISQVLKTELAHLKIDTQTKIITGQAACLGTARGQAVIVLSQKDYHKIKAGDILVTTMTKPDIMPYLKKVKGIVTNDGGALSHASIISREMKIPCLTGTKYATDIIKDGENLLLEVAKGVINRLDL
jgi:phosphoenolpyruvate synthase/pyruvate phosphate dikinase